MNVCVVLLTTEGFFLGTFRTNSWELNILRTKFIMTYFLELTGRLLIYCWCLEFCIFLPTFFCLGVLNLILVSGHILEDILTLIWRGSNFLLFVVPYCSYLGLNFLLALSQLEISAYPNVGGRQ